MLTKTYSFHFFTQPEQRTANSFLMKVEQTIHELRKRGATNIKFSMEQDLVCYYDLPATREEIFKDKQSILAKISHLEENLVEQKAVLKRLEESLKCILKTDSSSCLEKS